MKRSIRNYFLLPAAAALIAFGLAGCNNRGNSPRDSQSEHYAPNGNGASPGGGVGTGRSGHAGAGNAGSGGATSASGNGGANAGGSGGAASTPTSRP